MIRLNIKRDLGGRQVQINSSRLHNSNVPEFKRKLESLAPLNIKEAALAHLIGVMSKNQKYLQGEMNFFIKAK